MAEASCSATTAQVTGGGAASSTLTVTTTAPHQVSSVELPGRGSMVALGVVFAGLFWFGSGKRRERRWMLLMWIGVLSPMLLLASCGGGSSRSGGGGGGGGHTDQGTPTGTYTLTLTASSGALSHAMQVSVTVQ